MYRSDARFKSPCKEVCKGTILMVSASCLLNFDTIQHRKKTIHWGSEADRHIHFADVSCDARLQSRKRNEIFYALVFLEKLINIEDIKHLTHNFEEWEVPKIAWTVHRVLLELVINTSNSGAQKS